jgi:biopolymer transport protein ExbD
MRKKGKAGESPKLDMTPMIDVVFQLLIFFVVTLKQDDILSKLTGARPSLAPVNESSIDLINIGIDTRGFALNGHALTQEALNRQVGRLASFSQSAQVVIRCTADSPHALLVQSLDICNQHGMTKVSILSR